MKTIKDVYLKIYFTFRYSHDVCVIKKCKKIGAFLTATCYEEELQYTCLISISYGMAS